MNKKMIIIPKFLRGIVKSQPSKSFAHRYIIGAGIADGTSKINNIVESKDILTTKECLKKIGIKIDVFSKEDRKIYYVTGIGGNFKYNNNLILNFNESASTMRFLIPLLLNNNKVKIICSERLFKRPLDIIYYIFKKNNILYKKLANEFSLIFYGKLKEREYNIKGNISSQFITGLLFALPLLSKDSIINIVDELESKYYVDITLEVLKKFNIFIENKNYKQFKVYGNQKYKSLNIDIEGDFSQLSFFAVAGLIGKNPIKCINFNNNSVQGDKIIIDIIKNMNGKIEKIDNNYIFYPSKTKSIIIDIKNCIDLFPAILILSIFSKGKTEIINIERLKIKESDRLNSLIYELKKMGAKIKIEKNKIIINGIKYLNGGNVYSWNDHRIAMSIAISSIRSKNLIKLSGYSCVDKSYPDFWKDFKKIGGKIIIE